MKCLFDRNYNFISFEDEIDIRQLKTYGGISRENEFKKYLRTISHTTTNEGFIRDLCEDPSKFSKSRLMIDGEILYEYDNINKYFNVTRKI